MWIKTKRLDSMILESITQSLSKPISKQHGKCIQDSDKHPSHRARRSAFTSHLHLILAR